MQHTQILLSPNETALAKMFSRIEQALFDRGHVNRVHSLQNAVKFVEFFYRLRWSQKSWIDDMLNIEFKAISLIQAEIADAGIVHSLQKLQKIDGNMTRKEEETLEKAQKRLSEYNTHWWAITHKYYQLLFHKPKGCYIRQLDLFRNAHLSDSEEKVQSACKAVGGCCAYDCGCCYRDRGSHRRPGVLMHCVRECGCCLRRRGFELTYTGKDRRPLGIIVVDYWYRNGVRR